jgi:putative DNA primase/helicase
MLDLKKPVRGRGQATLDYGLIARAALMRAASLVPDWLPDGERRGHEWVARNPRRADTSRGSFAVNLRTGLWADFATGDKGGDLISLRAYLDGISQRSAAEALAAEVL